jgi:hypothetical protein
MGGGKAFPQVFCALFSSPFGASRPFFTDDVIYGHGTTAKTALFQLVVLLDTIAEASMAIQDLNSLAEVYNRGICVQEATYLVVDPSGGDMVAKGDLESVWKLVTAQEYDVTTWHGLPEPLGYDASRLRRDVKEKYVILRPDRFIFAACRTLRELEVAVEELGNFS